MRWTLLESEFERAGGCECMRVVFGDGADIVEVVATLEMHGPVVVLSDVHVGGSAANRIGARRLTELARWVKQELRCS